MIFLAISLFSWSASAKESIAQTLIKNEKGEEVELRTLKADNEILVLLFVSSNCPVTTVYWDRIKGSWYNFREKEVRMVIVGGNSDDSLEAIRTKLKEKDLEIPLFWNQKFSLAKSLGIQFTPTAVVLGRDWKILYRGRLDDSWRVESRIKNRYLDSAILAALDNKHSKDRNSETFMGSRMR
jgi:peroxiredoxin